MIVLKSFSLTYYLSTVYSSAGSSIGRSSADCPPWVDSDSEGYLRLYFEGSHDGDNERKNGIIKVSISPNIPKGLFTFSAILLSRNSKIGFVAE